MKEADYILQNLTIEQIFDFYGIEHAKRMKCPLHCGEDKNFTYNGIFYMCFSHCGGGNLINFVMNFFGIDFCEAIKKISNDFNLGLFEKISKSQQIDLNRKIFLAQKKAKSEQERRNNIQKKYWEAFDEWKKYDDILKKYKPKNQNDVSAVFLDALDKIEFLKFNLSVAETELFEIIDKK